MAHRNIFRRSRNISVMIAVFMLVLTGCTYPSGEKVFQPTESPDTRPAEDASQMLSIAVETMEHADVAQKFWYSGWVASHIQKRQVNSMFDGVVVRPHGYLVNARVNANPYRYYKWDDHYYLYTEKSGWVKLEKEEVPMDPLAGFEWWQPFADRAVRLPDEPILSKNCRVYQIEANGQEWVELSANPLFEEIRSRVQETDGMEHILQNTTVKMTLWIGDESYTREQVEDWAAKNDVDTDNQEELDQWIERNRLIWNEAEQVYKHHLIYQYETWINMPVPSAGYMDQQTFFRFYKFDDPGIKMKSPAEMEAYLDDEA
ncbi:MAG: hypothetical protein H0Z33_00320 [Bacillaceae bacterium]|nr:hypothetical protein [Bacillaceae bacterium]